MFRNDLNKNTYAKIFSMLNAMDVALKNHWYEQSFQIIKKLIYSIKKGRIDERELTYPEYHGILNRINRLSNKLKTADIIYFKALFFENANEIDEAFDTLNKLHEQCPDYWPAYTAHGWLLQNVGKHSEAITYFQKVLTAVKEENIKPTKSQIRKAHTMMRISQECLKGGQVNIKISDKQSKLLSFATMHGHYARVAWRPKDQAQNARYSLRK